MKLDNTRIKKVLRLIADGNTIGNACILAGVHRATYYRWLDEGRKHAEDAERRIQALLDAGTPEDQIKPEPPTLQMQLLDGVPEAQARSEAGHLKNIRTAGKEDWKASAWFLERTRPERYARRVVSPEAEQTDELVIIG